MTARVRARGSSCEEDGCGRSKHRAADPAARGCIPDCTGLQIPLNGGCSPYCTGLQAACSSICSPRAKSSSSGSVTVGSAPRARAVLQGLRALLHGLPPVAGVKAEVRAENRRKAKSKLIGSGLGLGLRFERPSAPLRPRVLLYSYLPRAPAIPATQRRVLRVIDSAGADAGSAVPAPAPPPPPPPPSTSSSLPLCSEEQLAWLRFRLGLGFGLGFGFGSGSGSGLKG